MDRSVYIAASSNKYTMLTQAVNANNLANINTPGFRADLMAVRSLPVSGPGYATRVYSGAAQPGVEFRQGPVLSTGRDLDVAIRGAGWIAVQAKDGTEGYTRAGNLQVTEAGLLLTGSGQPVLGNNGPIAIPPAEKMEIGADGTISIRPVGQEASTLAVVDRIKLVNPPMTQLRKNEHGLLQLPNNETAPADAGVTLESGSLESSNVDAIGAMISMIDMARDFELKIKLMKTDEENAASAAQLLRLGQ
jgi:flagellar basal-body rod protein FlgF